MRVSSIPAPSSSSFCKWASSVAKSSGNWSCRPPSLCSAACSVAATKAGCALATKKFRQGRLMFKVDPPLTRFCREITSKLDVSNAFGAEYAGSPAGLTSSSYSLSAASIQDLSARSQLPPGRAHFIGFAPWLEHAKDAHSCRLYIQHGHRGMSGKELVAWTAKVRLDIVTVSVSTESYKLSAEPPTRWEGVRSPLLLALPDFTKVQRHQRAPRPFVLLLLALVWREPYFLDFSR